MLHYVIRKSSFILDWQKLCERQDAGQTGHVGSGYMKKKDIIG